MKPIPMCFVLLPILAFGVIPGFAQTDRTFTGNESSSWHDSRNWDPDDDYPQAGDKAIIPTGKTCSVQSVDDAAEIVQIDAGGTLVIDGQTLTLDTDGDGTHDTPKLTVNGEVRFEGTNATLVYGNPAPSSGTIIHFVFDGAGTVLADGLPDSFTARGWQR